MLSWRTPGTGRTRDEVAQAREDGADGQVAEDEDRDPRECRTDEEEHRGERVDPDRHPAELGEELDEALEQPPACCFYHGLDSARGVLVPVSRERRRGPKPPVRHR